MAINIAIFVIIGLFVIYDLYSACRSFIGHNPNAPGAWARIKAWWPGFVKRNIVDIDPCDDEGHSIARYMPDESDEGPKR